MPRDAVPGPPGPRLCGIVSRLPVIVTLRNWLYFDTDSQYTPPSTRVSHTHTAACEQQTERQIAERTQELERVIAQLRTRQQQLEVEVNHDTLTGLANRKLLHDRFQCALQRAKRSGFLKSSTTTSAASGLPMMTMPSVASISGQPVTTAAGSNIMPTDTKNSTAKASRIGSASAAARALKSD